MITKLITFIFVYSRLAAANNLYPKYHLSPDRGWMNDPNGFCFFNGVYHLFYQHNPYSSYGPGIVHWGHAVSTDFFHWKHLPVALNPDQWYDDGGVFSGSCLVDAGKMYLYYTGNVNHEGETPDHSQYQALATSDDGYNIAKYEMNPIINGSGFQPDLRDPKIWKHGDKYYMVLGNSFKGESNETLGRILLWESSDKINWEKASILLESDGRLGYMFECPDFFELDGHWILLFSPQGVKPDGDKYNNLYQTGHIIGDFSYETKTFTPLYDFQELDHGHDFYATQTTLDEDGSRVVIAWMDMWDQNYPEMDQGFAGQMTLARKLKLGKNGILLQKPVKDIDAARGRVLHSGVTRGGKVIKLVNNTGEILIRSSPLLNLDVFIESEGSQVQISYDRQKGTITLDRGGNDAVRRTNWRPLGKLTWRLYIDSSSIELFCGNGEVTFSSRFFPTGPVSIRLGRQSIADNMTVRSMKQTVDISYPEPTAAETTSQSS
ncbi:raffinose invertase-like [Pieris napi]|uniref:raffinose invertase-like n=1 Tax=Pieris napi TaxID=78633 RepID=UPI001FB95714|nr:raffinose invertase-like [Pieris napi]